MFGCLFPLVGPGAGAIPDAAAAEANSMNFRLDRSIFIRVNRFEPAFGRMCPRCLPDDARRPLDDTRIPGSGHFTEGDASRIAGGVQKVRVVEDVKELASQLQCPLLTLLVRLLLDSGFAVCTFIWTVPSSPFA